MPRDKNIFTLNPTSLDMKRSVFNRNSQHKTSFNLGEIIPVYMDEILPGDTVSMDLAQVIRMSTPIAPIMDNIYADVYFFFVPNRLVWSNWQQFCGENDQTAWTQTHEYHIPTADIGSDAGAVCRGSIGDYLGLPVQYDYDQDQSDPTVVPINGNNPFVELDVSELPLRAYYKIYNDWFRDENSIAPVLYTIGNTSNANITYNDKPCKASRFHDMFSSALPAPQKGAAVQVPVLGGSTPVQFVPSESQTFSNNDIFNDTYFVGKGKKYLENYFVTDANMEDQIEGKLMADLSQATQTTINALRLAFQVQKLLEKDARGGTRYIELLKAHFGVTSPDARLQRSEYLAGHRFRINVDQVVATADSGSEGSSLVGQTGAVSKTTQAGSMFTKSFVEHGLLIGLVVLRQDHTYSQGLDKYWLKKDRFDFYYPVLANIGEEPLKKINLAVITDENGALDLDAVFGYQEAWYEYRFKPSRCTGYMNPALDNSLNYWTLGDVYSDIPGLNANFLEETPDFLDRALQVQSSEMHQFIADFYFKAKYSRVMPLYSIPGLIDHH